MVTSFKSREKTRTSSPCLCTWTRAPSSLYSSAAGPRLATASSSVPAGEASMGSTGRKSSKLEAGETGGPFGERGMRHGPQLAAQHRRAPDVGGRDSRGARHRVLHQPLQGALAHFAEQHAGEPVGFLGGGPPHQAGEHLPTRARRSGARERREPIELAIDIGDAERGLGRVGLRRGPTNQRGADADALLPRRPRQERHGGDDFLGPEAAQQRRQEIDLGVAARGRGECARGLGEFGDPHGSSLTCARSGGRGTRPARDGCASALRTRGRSAPRRPRGW